MKVSAAIYQKWFIILGVLCSITLFFVFPAMAATNNSSDPNQSDLQNQINSDLEQMATLNQKIAEYQAELNKAGADKNTLQRAIKTLDLQRDTVSTQISETQKQIHATELQIAQLGGQINTTEKNIDTAKAGVAASLRYINESDSDSVIMQLMAANNFAGFWQNVKNLLEVQKAFLLKARYLESQEKTLAEQQNASQQKKQALADQNQTLSARKQTLTATVTSKSQLLTETKNKESNYQKLLAAAKSELESFSAFIKNAGGDQLLPHETSCDPWGCYYNQRDAYWGATALNGTGYTLASSGCLVTSVAMVLTHYGYHDVTPVTINSDPNNFAPYFPAFLLTTISVDGITASRVTANIDATLAGGKPVIVGLRVYGGTHFVVLISGSHGHYVMRDPYIPNGNDINFSDHYNVNEIYEINKVIIS